MAVVITPFPHQRIMVGTPFSLDIPISGNPSRAYLSGDVRGFRSHWTGTHLQWRGSSDTYTISEEVVVIADDERYTGTFTVVPITPIIAPLSRVTVNRGEEVTIPIPITGHVTDLTIRGPWIGLKQRLTDARDGEYYGTIDASADFTQRLFQYSVTAYNNVGGQSVFDTATLEIEIAVGG